MIIFCWLLSERVLRGIIVNTDTITLTNKENNFQINGNIISENAGYRNQAQNFT